ncbi:5-formyltetrahydrofolate cyclo-ligase [Oceanicella actignis]|uniref:5-formyltetrahydrofolate cyclo-ligase n=1 Tax=Oceanicella actignis TaxID=1189325 RepID=UPI0011E79447|nr:5-formyltetrahydrofolate cyclo-ligase [Oceanicella actignis]TYO84713.1 5-formyltetrahydrofolate cyclo-ligase [Oceanicella actignis]
MSDPDDAPRGYASPPCLAHEQDPGFFDPLATDSRQARDVARWRRAERERLLARRRALSAAQRARIARAASEHLSRLLSDRFGTLKGRAIAAYWPIKGELDLRASMARWHEAGAFVALPVVERKAAPLAFRRWTPATRMVRGVWNIPSPPPDAAPLVPEIALAPLVGWALDADGAAWRLGYGGGYLDRTLAALAPRPFAIGVGLAAARLSTILAQPHDVPLDAIVTEEGIAGEGP